MEEEKVYVSLVATPLKDGEAATILDEEKYHTLTRMFKSKDETDHKMGQLILNTCDLGKSIYWIWELARAGYCYRMVNLRTKAGRYIKEKLELYHLGGKSHLSFAEYCNRRGWLTPEIYHKLEDKVIDSVHNQFKNTFYDVAFKVKDKYQHLPINKSEITVKYE